MITLGIISFAIITGIAIGFIALLHREQKQIEKRLYERDSETEPNENN